jgi:hypothetical protein
MRRMRRKAGMSLMIISKDANYTVLDEQILHCDELQFQYMCNKCEEYMLCYYCEFDYNKPHECEPEI